MTAKQYSKTKKKSDLDKPVTLGLLLEYTDEFLIPRMAEMVEENNQRMDLRMNGMKKELIEEIRASEHRLKTYVDRKITETKESSLPYKKYA